jgi:hypothetical protein
MGGVQPCAESLKAGGAEAGEILVTVGAMVPILSMFETIGRNPTEKNIRVSCMSKR